MIFKKNNPVNSYKHINYGSESVDVTLKCCNYLKSNNYFNNTNEDNLFLLERALINYSILKFRDFDIDVSKIKNIDWDDLAQILKKLDKYIPTLQDKQEFFSQYNQCIIYIHSSIKEENPIVLNYGDELVIDDLDNPSKITLNKNLPSYENTLLLFNIIKDTYKKNPVLKK